MATRKKKVDEIVPNVHESLGEMLGMEESVPEVVEEYKEVKLSPFDFMTAISFSKEHIITDEVTEGQYSPWVVNNGLSQSQDAILWSNVMNCRSHISKKAQFLFLLHTVPKRKRYEKWAKSTTDEDLDMVMSYYGYSRNKAVSIMKILTAENLKFIKTKMFIGG